MASDDDRYTIEPYCVLCRDPLLSPTDRKRVGVDSYEDPKCELEKWQTDVIAYFPLPDWFQGYGGGEVADATRQDMCAFPFDIGHSCWPHDSPQLTSVREMYNLGMCSNPVDCLKCTRHPKRSIGLVHGPCYQLAHQRFGARTRCFLHLISRRTYPLIHWRRTLHTSEGRSPHDHGLHAVPAATIRNDTSLGQLLTTISEKLPPEVQSIILSMAPGLFQSLGRASVTLDWSTSPTTNIELPPEPPELHIPSKPFGKTDKIRRIEASTTNVLDETCLVRIQASNSDTSPNDSIPVLKKRIFGIQISFGIFGVTGLRILYANQILSPWLGKPGRWFLTHRCGDLSRLETWSDRFKIVRISLDMSRDDTQSLDRQPEPLVWSYPHPQGFAHRTHQIMDVGNRASQLSEFFNSDLRLSQFLSLEPPEGRRLESITTRFNRHGILSIITNSDASLGIGPPHMREISITHFIDEGEFILSVRVISRGVEGTLWNFRGTHLLLFTSQNRILHYGWHSLLRSLNRRISSFHDTGPSKVVGLFTTPDFVMPMQSIGIATEPLAAADAATATAVAVAATTHMRIIPVPNEPYRNTFFNRWKHDAYSNKASLRNVKALTVQKRRLRCIGIRIDYLDGRTRVLGQWEPARGFTRALWAIELGIPLNAIYFTYAGSSERGRTLRELLDNHEMYVQHISLEPPAEGVPCFVWNTFDQAIVWWFNLRYDDLEAMQGEEMMTDLSTSSFPPREAYKAF